MITGLGGLIPQPADALFHNNRDGTFTDVTSQAGIPARTFGRGIAWGDYNNDGNIDVYIARGASAPIPPDGSTKTSLYRNNGDGTFTEVTDQAGVGITSVGMPEGVEVVEHCLAPAAVPIGRQFGLSSLGLAC